MATLSLSLALALALALAPRVAAAGAAPPVLVERFEAPGALGRFVAASGADYASAERGPMPVRVEAPAPPAAPAAPPAGSADDDEAPAATAAAEPDYGLVLAEPARRYAVTAPFSDVLSLTDDLPLVVQYEVQLQEGLSCGGAYVKLYEASPGFDAAAVTPSTPYVIMFGPDRCGATDKVHLIVRWRNPVTGAVEEKHLQIPPHARGDKVVHLYTLVLRPDATYSIKVDDKVEKQGSLADDMSPPVLPPRQIDDPADNKPADWVDDEKVPDPAATKPEDWDESQPLNVPDADAVMPERWLENEKELMADPSAKRPEDWDDEEDGVWAAPTVVNPKCEAAPGCGPWTRPTKRNPLYKGKWTAPLVDNPLYKGKWTPRRIDNPAFYEDAHLGRLGGAAMGALGAEVWTMQAGITFDNFFVSRSEAEASEFASRTFAAKFAAQTAAVAAADKAAEIKRLATAAEKGGVLDRIALYFNQAKAMALANPATAIGAAALVVASIIGLCVLLCCQAEPEIMTMPLHTRAAKPAGPRPAAPAASAAAASAPAKGSGTSEEHDVEEEEEDEAADVARMTAALAASRAKSAKSATAAPTVAPAPAPAQAPAPAPAPMPAPASSSLPAADVETEAEAAVTAEATAAAEPELAATDEVMPTASATASNGGGAKQRRAAGKPRPQA